MSTHELLDIPFTKGKCILVRATLHTNTGAMSLPFYTADFILDTGATTTHISKRLLLRMGYNETQFNISTYT